MTSLSIFNFNNSNVRIQLLVREPLFCLSDVAKILNIKNVQANRFNLDSRGVHKMSTPTYNQHGTEVKQKLLFINEPNLYRVIFRSNKKEAIDFQNWVFDEVLPTLRKNGSYSITINLEQQQAIRQAVSQRAYRNGEHHQAVYHKLYEEFKIPRYQDLPASRFEEAIRFLGGVKINHIQFTDDELYKISRLFFISYKMHNGICDITPALEKIFSKYADRFHGMAFHFKRELNEARLIIERETSHISDKGFTNKWNNVLPIIRTAKKLV